MKKNKTHQYNQDHLSVISLKRTPHRLDNFFRRNYYALNHWNIHIIDGVDGEQHREVFKKSRLIDHEVLQRWSPGAIGSALSHMICWRLCLQLGKPMVVAEDDAILATELKHNLNVLLQGTRKQTPFLLWGGTLTQSCRQN